MRKRTWLTKNRFQIGVISSSVLAIAVAIIASTIFSPAQIGLGRGYTRNIERDNANRIIKTIDVERDWLSLLGVPTSLVILGFLLQLFQQKRLDEKAKEEVLQIYFDRLSKLLIDENLIALAKKLKIKKHGEAIQSDKELLESAKGIIKARTISVLRRLEDDRGRKFDVIQFLIETEVFSTLGLDTNRLDLQSFDLEGINLQKANLREANFEKMNLKGANFQGANLTNANLNGTDLTQANLSDANLTQAKLNGATLEEAILKGSKLSRAYLRKANLQGAELFEFQFNENVDVKGTDLSGTDLRGADLRGADLRLVDLQGADLSRAKLQGAKISGIYEWSEIFPEYSYGSEIFPEYSYENKTLVTANLKDAILREAVLTDIDFEGVCLEGANLAGANLTRANLSAAQGVTEEQLNQAKLCQTKLPGYIRLDANRDCKLK